MSQGFIVPLPQRLFDANGVPADGWLIHTYVANTSTPLATYSDATLLSLNDNPIEADADGYFRCFVAEAVLVKLAVHNAADVLQYSLDNLEPMPDTTGSSGSVTAVPTGGIIFYAASLAMPTGFLRCDGSLVSRATYSSLSTLLAAQTPAYPYGDGDGATTFALPDLRGRFPLGQAAAGTGSTLGSTGGSIDHTHTGPSHTHVVSAPRDGWGSTTTTPNVAGRILTGLGAGGSNDQADDDVDVTSAAGGTGNTGTANPPYAVGVWIIKT